MNKAKFDHIINSLEDSSITVTSVVVHEDLYADLVNELGAEVSDDGYDTSYSFNCIKD